MSPHQRRGSLRRSSDTRPDDITSLNSTATMFVGGRRKSWMTGTSGSSAPAPNVSLSPTSSIAPPCRENLQSNQTGSATSQKDLPKGTGHAASSVSLCGPLPISPVSIENDPLSTVSPQAVPTQLEKPSGMAVPPSPLDSSEPSTRPVSEATVNRDEPRTGSTAPRDGPLSLQEPNASPAMNMNMAMDMDMNMNSVAPSYAGGNGVAASEAHRDKRLRTDASQPPGSPLGPPASQIPPPQINPKNFVTFIDRIHSRYGPLEQSRLSLLREACNAEDLFYLALHQIYCSWSLAQLSAIVASGFTPLHAQGLGIVGNLLVVNSSLQSDFVHTCSRFPAPLETLVQADTSFRFAIEQVLHALALFADRWHTFQQSIDARNYPPLIDELIAEFCLSSSTFQGVVFSSCCRRLGVHDDIWYQRHIQLFRSNQEAYQRRLQSMNTSNPVTLEQMQRENGSLILSYQQLRIQQLAAAEAHPRTTHVSQNVVTRAQQPSVQVVSTAQNFFSSPTSVAPLQSNQVNQPMCQMPMSQQLAPQRGGLRHLGLRGAPAIRAGTGRSPPVFSQLHATSNPPQPVHLAPTRGRGRGRIPLTGRGGVRAMSSSMPPHLIVPPSSGPTTPVHPTPPIYQHPNGHAAPAGHPWQTIQLTPLLPPPNFTPVELSRPNPDLIALHEAPWKTTTRYIGQPHNDNESKPTFQYLQGFALHPTPLGPRSPLFQWHFNVSTEQFQKVPLLLPPGKDGHTIWGVDDGSQTYQLRCVKVTQNTATMSEDAWAVADTCWPNAIYIHVNGSEHFARRKAHHGKDLPVDITKSIKQGSNEVRLTFLRSNEEFHGTFYAVAVEVLDHAVHDRICASVQHLSLADSLGTIQERLAGSTTTDDDEVAVVGNFITIDLMDPFSARIYDVPARGKYCEHRECFDLETFFNTRLLKHSKSQGMAEDWKCPICGKDARPHALVIDDFLVVVRNRIMEVKQDDARAIHVSADGTWKVKTSIRSKENTPASKPGSQRGPVAAIMPGEGQMSNGQLTAQSNETSHTEVIELD